ncbi:MAG: energy transducer TonB [Spirochaetota bacterium]
MCQFFFLVHCSSQQPSKQSLTRNLNHRHIDSKYPIDLTPKIQPKYTARARRARIEGRILLALVISKEGKVLRVQITGKKLGYGLDESAISVYKRKRFIPAKKTEKQSYRGS